jgi:tetratricopeptide (TPR) repeat protein
MDLWDKLFHHHKEQDKVESAKPLVEALGTPYASNLEIKPGRVMNEPLTKMGFLANPSVEHASDRDLPPEMKEACKSIPDIAFNTLWKGFFDKNSDKDISRYPNGRLERISCDVEGVHHQLDIDDTGRTITEKHGNDTITTEITASNRGIENVNRKTGNNGKWQNVAFARNGDGQVDQILQTDSRGNSQVTTISYDNKAITQVSNVQNNQATQSFKFAYGPDGVTNIEETTKDAVRTAEFLRDDHKLSGVITNETKLASQPFAPLDTHASDTTNLQPIKFEDSQSKEMQERMAYLKAHPKENMKANYELAIAANSGNTPEAKRHFQDVIDLANAELKKSPNDPQLYYFRAISNAGLGNDKAAFGDYKKVEELAANNPHHQEYAERVAHGISKLDKNLIASASAEETAPQHVRHEDRVKETTAPVTHSEHEQKHKREQPVKHDRTAEQKHEDAQVVASALKLIKAGYDKDNVDDPNHNYQKAALELEMHLAKNPNDPVGHYLAGVAYHNMNKFHKAIDEYKKTLAIKDASADVRSKAAQGLATLNVNLGDIASAREAGFGT